MEDEKTKAFKNWPEPRLVRGIQVFIGFANFYGRFIQGFSRIAAPITSMLIGPSPRTQVSIAGDEVDGGSGGRENSSKLKNPKSRNRCGGSGLW